MTISAERARHYYLIGLRNVHGAVKEGQSLVEMLLKRLEHYPEFLPKLRSHLDEKHAQLARIETILGRHGESPSTLKDAAGTMTAMLAGMTHAAADDEIIKNCLTTVALATFEASSYELLVVFAEAAGDTEALPALRQSVSEERAMADFVKDNLRPVGLRFLELDSAGADASH